MDRLRIRRLTVVMTNDEILLLAGTGKTGSRAAALLHDRGVPVRALSRRSTPRFDWTDETTWTPALTGVRAVYLIPHPSESLATPLLSRAADLGVERVVVLSGRGVDVPGYAESDNGEGITLVEAEQAARESGLEWTILRPTWFSQNFSEGFFLDAIVAGELRLPAGAGRAPFIDADDIAAVAVAALTEDGHSGQIYELGGPRSMTFDEAVAEIAQGIGRDIRYVPVEPEQYVSELVGQGWPPAGAADFAEIVGAIRRGLDTHLSDGVQRALGREPRDFADFVKTAVSDGAWQ